MRIDSARPDPWRPHSGFVTITLSADEASMLAGNCRALSDIAGRNESDVELDLRRASDAANDREMP
jgi:hypothetical protein